MPGSDFEPDGGFGPAAPAREGNERRVEEALLKLWTAHFPILDRAREGLADAESASKAAAEDLREAEAAVEAHEYSRLLAARDAARERVEQAAARKRRALDSLRSANEGVPHGGRLKRVFDAEHAEWRREQESAGRSPAKERG